MDIFALTLPFIVGMAVGAVYFAALWLTVSRVTAGSLAPAWLLVSAVFRLALLIGVLFWIMDGQLNRLLAALVGFLLVRFAAIWQARMRKRENQRTTETAAMPEGSDATNAR